MPDGKLPDGRRVFDVLRHANATQFTRADGLKILVRPDGYIARISTDDTSEYAGAPVMKCAIQ